MWLPVPPDDKNNWREEWRDFVCYELLTSAFGLFTGTSCCFLSYLD